MVEIELDGKKVEVAEGSMVMHAAEKAGNYIPHFCYHKKLSIAANCRMCLVDVEKAPKPMPACATPVTQGMIVRTRSDKAVAAQKSVMEFLLINHPLDCPVCDKGGECPLQNQAMSVGRPESRFTEEKRTFEKPINVSAQILLDRERCVSCARCTRFADQIAGGQTVEDIAEPYRQRMADLLELNPADVDLSDKKIQAALRDSLRGYCASERILSGIHELLTVPALNGRAGVLGALMLARDAFSRSTPSKSRALCE